MTEAVHPVAFFASAQFLKTGRPRCVYPAFLEFTPPTIFVPYFKIVVWYVPCFIKINNKWELMNEPLFQSFPNK